MTLNLKIYHDASGCWSVHGLPARPATHLPSLAASIDYARRQCDKAPATIELIIDGYYAFSHQEKGWPRQLLAPETECWPLPGENCAARGPGVFTQLRDWLRGVG